MFLTYYKQLSIALLMSVSMLPAVGANPAKQPVIDKNMKLAMLNLTRNNAVVRPTAAAKPAQNNSKKIVKKAQPKLTFPDNCISWNARQVHAKADQYDTHITKYAKKHNVDTNLVKSIITAESCFKRKALSSAGAQGLMQLIPDTADRFGVTDSYDPQQNIRAGVKYLRFLLDRYKGNIEKAIAGYNAGEGAVDKYNGIPPYKETKQYVKNVLRIYAVLNPDFDKKRVKAVYQPPKLGAKPGRHGWQFNRTLAPHLYKKMK
ncbi:lytic transglycosylase domain-containing protein [Cocleimonas sp. KMM 6892]|uniref:lytic transglycosylase domain-containing protein n=1 Tax=unclassified Cocleimonas TaxID=2639732 RepID=UPI002DB68935|nr:MULTISPECIES: lytic transglycosylase domain-containing protein [unclassified Cocleimonas]MEB8431999.1 lytic transglycosylase domain-containing protein [Cocleimonas sp. KMM 6892]MEC4714915.1 lytic transglycosylase domain-containing protein [Cocleimonas sp. KMM 6895]MEC4744271.1 lytic transglycosylase domain-containing protein [Cocleimonas sp. KMM 6896]